MPNLADHQSNEYTKCLIVGDSKAGKTGALVSLVDAGYQLFIEDYDNGLDVLKQYIMKVCPDKIGNVEYVTLQDKRKATPSGSIIDGQPKAFVEGIKLMDRWKYGDVDYGVPATWGPNCIFVIDSLSRFSDAAYDWREPLATRGRGGQVDGRMVYFDAQQAVIEAMSTLYSVHFKCNVIVIAHVRYLDLPDGTKKGFPQSVGSAICSEIPQYFNTYALFENIGGKRTLRTTSTPLIDLANPAPFAMAPRYPIETALADVFGVLRPKPIAKPKLVRR